MRRWRRRAVLALATALFVGLVLAASAPATATHADGVDDGLQVPLLWRYVRPVTLDHHAGAVTNATVPVSLDTKALIDEGKMQPDCSDVRVTTSDGASLSYRLGGGCDTAETQVWVQVPEVPADGRTIYLYYGNPAAHDASSDIKRGFAVFASGWACSDRLPDQVSGWEPPLTHYVHGSWDSPDATWNTEDITFPDGCRIGGSHSDTRLFVRKKVDIDAGDVTFVYRRDDVAVWSLISPDGFKTVDGDPDATGCCANRYEEASFTVEEPGTYVLAGRVNNCCLGGQLGLHEVTEGLDLFFPDATVGDETLSPLHLLSGSGG